MKHLNASPLILIVALFCTIFFSCNSKKSIPFPDNASGYKTPVTKSFKFPEAKPIIWKEISKDSVPQGKTVALDLEKLPSQPFTLNDFKPLKSPVEKIKLDWDNLEEHPINLDTIKGVPFNIKSFLLPDPVITKANPPGLLPNTTSGILQLGTEEGLLGSIISATIVDKFGMIWFSTERGLIRHKGDYFETYSFLPKLENGDDDHILSISDDKNGNLWLVAQNGGIYMLDISLGVLHHLEIKGAFYELDFDLDGKMWVSDFNEGVSFIDYDRQTIHRIVWPAAPKDMKLAADLTGLIKDRQGNIWIGYQNHICILNPGQSAYKILGVEEGLPVQSIFGFFESKNGDIWISSGEKGAYTISIKDNTIKVLGEKQGYYAWPAWIAEDHMGKIWLVDNDTIYTYKPDKEMLKKLPTGVKIRHWSSQTTKTDLNGNIWIGTYSNQMLIIDPLGNLSEHLNVNSGLLSNDVWGIVEDKNGLIWMGTYNGVNIYDPSKNKMMVLNADNGLNNNRIQSMSLLDEDHILAKGNSGFSIIDLKNKTLTGYKMDPGILLTFSESLLDQDGDIWIGASSGILVFNPENGTMKRLLQDSERITNRIWKLQKDDDGNIWAGTENGVYVINPRENSIRILGENDGLISDFSEALHKTSSGEMWIGGNMGISIIDLSEKTVTNITEKEGLKLEGLWDFAELNNRMYVGSGNGVIVVERPDSATGKDSWGFYNYGKREGFPFNDYNQMTATSTKSGQIWWGVTPIVTVLTQEPFIDSKQPVVFVTGVKIMDQNPSFKDFNYLDSHLQGVDTLWNDTGTEYYLRNSLPQDSSYWVDNSIAWDSITPLFHLPIGLELPYHQNSLNFSFTNPNIKSRDKIVYRYILDGRDINWSGISDEPISKTYYNLTPGDYSFKVATRGFNGIWSEPASLSFTILPPWWLTWWAYCIYGLLFITATYTIYRIQKRQVIAAEQQKVRAKELEQAKEIAKAYKELKSTQTQLIQSEKMASLGELTAGIAHEIQNPLNFVNNFSEVSKELAEELKEETKKLKIDTEIISELAEDIVKNQEKINHHGNRASSIVRGMLSHSRIGSKQKELTDINKLADEYLRLAYHGLRAKDKSFNADFKADLDEGLPKINVIAQDIGRVLLNLINNAFYTVSKKANDEKETYKPSVIVSTKKVGDKVEIRVKDNGDGIPAEIKDKIFQPFFTTKPSGQGTGLGLSLSYDIITKGHDGQLIVETEDGQGTEFTIILPNK